MAERSQTQQALKEYFKEMKLVRGGKPNPENSYYSAPSTLINEISKNLKIDIFCGAQSRTGGKYPDFSLFSRERCEDGSISGADPEFGVIEMKALDADVRRVASGAQTLGYLETNGVVAVSNYREFLLLGKGKDGKPQEWDHLCLAESEDEFWELAEKPTAAAKMHALEVASFLRQIPMQQTRLVEPRDVAWLLAMHAKKTLERLESSNGGDLQLLQDSLEQCLGIKFNSKEQGKLFRSTLVQTLFYGLFSVWVKDGDEGRFSWTMARENISIPIIQTLFEQLTTLINQKRYGLNEVLDRATETLNRIDRTVFLDKFKDEDAIQHFYEPFLEQFDPDIRKEKGVWYTPKKIVEYMVERVDHVLRMDLDYKDGLADRKVYVLDPCCGTGAYILEVLRKIEKTHRAKKLGKNLTANYVKDAATKRVFGFEVMAAPLVIAHYQVGNFLNDLEVPIDSEKSEMAAIYLTNALSGWYDEVQPFLPLEEFKREYERAQKVKQKKPILVIIGNPPYLLKSKNDGSEKDLIAPYRDGKKLGIKIRNPRAIHDSYVKFIRVAERRIQESGEGVLCYITNYSYTSDESFPVMRHHLMDTFDKIWIDSLNGSLVKNNMETPEGNPDLSVFDTDRGTGIVTGTSIGLFLKRPTPTGGCEIKFRDLWGETKRDDLIESLKIDPLEGEYEQTNPTLENGFRFALSGDDSAYRSWPSINDLTHDENITGVIEGRNGACIDIDEEALSKRMRDYFDPNISWEELCEKKHPMIVNRARYDARRERERALQNENYNIRNLVRFITAPFDIRNAYHAETSKLWIFKQDKFRPYMKHKDGFLATRRNRTCGNEGFPVFFTRCLGSVDTAVGHSWYFPLKCRPPLNDQDPEWLRSVEEEGRANLAQSARRWLKDMKLGDPDKDEEVGDMPWHHALAIAWSPLYLRENMINLAEGWPRVPYPADAKVAKSSAILGRKVAELLDTERGAVGVTSGGIHQHLTAIGWFDGDDDRLKSWKRCESRGWSASELRALKTGFRAAGIDIKRGLELLGPPSDIALNKTTFWRGVPEAVWNCRIGGRRPVKNWITSRKKFGGGAASLQVDPRRQSRSCAGSRRSSSWPTISMPTTRPAATTRISGQQGHDGFGTRQLSSRDVTVLRA